MKNVNKKRFAILAGGLGAAGAVAALSLGATSALYTSTDATGQHNSITSGTIALTGSAPGSVQLNETGFMPGDSKTSKYVLSHQGEDAFVGVDVKITSTAKNVCAAVSDGAITPAALVSACTGDGEMPMFNGDATSGSMDLTVDYLAGFSTGILLTDPAFTGPASCEVVSGKATCVSELKNIILAPRPIGPNVPPGDAVDLQDDLVWNNGNSVPVSVKMTLPLSAGNVFQGSDVKVDLTGHAVQFANNYATWSSGVADPSTIRPGASGGNPNTIRLPKSWS